jgi:RND family efflux transporter MFP subunit
MPSVEQRRSRRIPLPGVGLQIAIVLILLAGAIGFGAGHMAQSEQREAKKKKTSMLDLEAASIVVNPWLVKEQAFWEELKEPATVYALRQVKISAELQGRVIKNHYQVGDVVSSAGVIVELDKTRKTLALEAANARVQLYNTRIQLLVKQMERMVKLRATNTVSEDELDRQTTALQTARIEKILAENLVAVAQRDLDAMTLSGPSGFTVISRLVEPGEHVSVAQVLVELADLRHVKVACQVAPDRLRYAHEIKCAQEEPEELRSNALAPTVQFMISGLYKRGAPHFINARIARISAAADPRTRRYLMELEAKNPKNILRAGLPAEVILRRKTLRKEVVVPREAVSKAHGLSVVYEIVDSKARARLVKIVAERGEALLAVTGIKAGVQIARGGASLLNDGSEIRVVETQK